MGSNCSRQICDHCCDSTNDSQPVRTFSSAELHEINIVSFKQSDIIENIELDEQLNHHQQEKKSKPSITTNNDGKVQEESIIIERIQHKLNFNMNLKKNEASKQLFSQLLVTLKSIITPQTVQMFLTIHLSEIKDYLVKCLNGTYQHITNQTSIQTIMKTVYFDSLCNELEALKEIIDSQEQLTCARELHTGYRLEQSKKIEQLLQKLLAFTQQFREVIFQKHKQYIKKVELVQNYLQSLPKDDCIELVVNHPIETQNRLKQRGIKFIRHIKQNNNSFFTALGYEYLKILLFKYNNNQFNKFLSKHSKQRMQITINKQSLFENDQIEQIVLELFFDQLQILRRKNQINRQFEFDLIYKKSNQNVPFFYQLSVIFFRNLCDSIIQSNELQNEDIQSYGWNEPINLELCNDRLAKELQSHINLIFQTNKQLTFQDYGDDEQNEIILISQKDQQFDIGYKYQLKATQQEYLDQDNDICYVISSLIKEYEELVQNIKTDE